MSSTLHLTEGGNVFKDKKTGQEFTQRINLEDVVPTVKWLEKHTGLSLLDNMLGTTGKKPTSGDLDLGVDEAKTSKEDLAAILLKIPGITKDDVKKSGSSVHLKTPIAGDPSKGFVQTDFMFGDSAWMRFAMQGGGKDSIYKGSHKHILLASIAKATKSEKHPEGLKWSYLNGLVDRATNVPISKNPDEIATVLLGPSHTAADMSNVETVINAIKDRPDFDVIVADANETYSKDKENPVPALTRNPTVLKESTETRIQHPEDMIYWEGSAGALKAVNALLELAENAPSTTTVKWDGSPAIVFGVDANGKFVLTDKGGFTVKSYKGRSESPEELEQMFLSRQNKPGKTLTPEYAQFASNMSGIFEPFKRALKTIHKSNGEGVFFKGDLLFMKQPAIVDGEFEFKPNVVTYRVPVNSDLGKLIGNSTVGVVLHGIMREDASGNITEEPLGELTNYFNGQLSSGGLLAGNVLIAAPVFVNKPPKFGREMIQLAEAAQTTVEKNAAAIDDLLDEATLTAKKMKDLPDVLYSYTNSKADNFASVSLEDFKNWAENNPKLSKQKIGNLQQYITTKPSGFSAMFEAIKHIEALKNQLVAQFDKQNTAVKAFVGNAPGGEGYVANSPSAGLVKLVNRGGFTAANRAVIRESVGGSKKKKLGFFPGSFKPLHRGHFESILKSAAKVNKLIVVTTDSDRVRPGEFPLNGQAARQYIETYIKPELNKVGVEIVFAKVPVRFVYEAMEKMEAEGDRSTEIYLFAGPEDIADRFSQESLTKYLPSLMGLHLVHPVALEEIKGNGEGDRISGTQIREYLSSGNVSGLAKALPNIPNVQKNIPTILKLFQDGAKTIQPKEKTARKKAAREQLPVPLVEIVALVVHETLLEAAKKGKFPKKYEPLIKKLKKRYGDPTKMKPGPAKEKAGALVFGTVQNLRKKKKS